MSPLSLPAPSSRRLRGGTAPRPGRRARRPRAAAAVAVALCATLLGACSSSDETGGTTSSVSDLTRITVKGAGEAKPTVSVPTPFTVTATQRRVLTPGTGATVAAGQRVTIDYIGINGTDGKEFDTSYGKDRSPFILDEKQIIKGMVTGLVGLKVGSRAVIAIPPADGYGTQGVDAANIGPTDTLVFLVDVRSSANVLKRATGTPVAPQAGLPKVALAADGRPTITVPAGKAPAKLVARALIAGSGAKVAKGQRITVHYTGVIWPGGKQFDSSWKSGAPATFPIGQGQVIAGWDEGLVGQRVGSQILLVVPPDKGYGAAGNAQAQIKGTDTLVFVVDILDAA